MLRQIRHYAGGFPIAVSLAGLLQAGLFCWVCREGVHQTAASSGVVAFRRFGREFWPTLPYGVPVLLVGLVCAGPSRQWFAPARPRGDAGG